jgi:hypothetical protein
MRDFFGILPGATMATASDMLGETVLDLLTGKRAEVDAYDSSEGLLRITFPDGSRTFRLPEDVRILEDLS